LLWHREINQQMLEEMWHSLVGLLHPTLLHQQPRSLDELFELLKDATWHDFFQVHRAAFLLLHPFQRSYQAVDA
jgi:hypothetical protein